MYSRIEQYAKSFCSCASNTDQSMHLNFLNESNINFSITLIHTFHNKFDLHGKKNIEDIYFF